MRVVLCGGSLSHKRCDRGNAQTLSHSGVIKDEALSDWGRRLFKQLSSTPLSREFLERDVPQEKLDRILELASRYPSAGHTEPQEFIVVRDQRVKRDLARAALDQMFVAQAPVVIVVISDVRRSARRYGERGVRLFSIIDGAFVAMLILLAVVEEGLGACFVGSFYDEEVQEVLSLPQEVRPVGIIPIGYCAEGPRKFRRRSREQIVHRDRYGRR
jgi:nitroreductase